MYVLWGDVGYWDMFMQVYASVQRFVREGDWYAGVEMEGGALTSRTFDNLMAFWPGMQTLMGEVTLASRTLNAFYLVWRDWGFLPEQFSQDQWALKEHGIGRAYPLRPELIESTLLVHRASGDTSWLWAGSDFLRSLQAFCRTECGYAGVRDVEDSSLDEQMPSFFLSETLKYLYLLFDEDNFIHKGNYVFSTEAHPFSIDAVRRGGHIPGGSRNGNGGGSASSSSSSSSSNSCGISDSDDSRSRQGAEPGVIGTEVGSVDVDTTQEPAKEQHQQADQEQRRKTQAPPPKPQQATEEEGKKTATSRRPKRRWWQWGRTRPSVGSYNSAPEEYGISPPPSPRSSDGGGGGSAGASAAIGDGGCWAARRASAAAEGNHRLGPEGWRDGNILFWAQGGDPTVVEAAGDEFSRLVISNELGYMEDLWEMYMTRTCPAPPAWDAPHPYNPASFVDTLVVGGRAAWVVIANGGGGGAQQSEQFGQTTTQTVFLEEVGLIEVLSAGHNNYVLHHPATGEVLEISPIFDALGGPGVPGGADGGAMQISSFVRPRPQQQQQQQQQQGNSEEAGAGQATTDDVRKEKAQVQGDVSDVANQQRSVEDDDRLEGSRGRAETKAPATGREMDDDGVTGTRRASEEEEKELEARVPGSEGARTAGGAAAPAAPAVSSRTAIDEEEEYEKEEAEEGEEGGERQQGGELEGEEAEGADEGLDRNPHGHGDQHIARGSGRQDRRVRRRPVQRRTFIVTKEGLSVYCLVSVVVNTDGNSSSSSSDNSRHYSCSLSTFSAPGNGMVVIPPVSAPLVLVKPNDGVSRGISLGCHLDAPVGADPTASGGAGIERGVDDGAGTPPRSFWDRLRGWFQQHRGSASSNGVRTTSDSGGGSYSGTIMVVLRGECTFEHKARVAEAEGAVGLVVINNEPGGVTLTMPGASNAGIHDDDEDEEEQGDGGVQGSGVNIPVAMVGLEDGVEIMKMLSAAATAGVDEEVDMQGVLDARTMHDSVFSRLIDEQKQGLRDSRGSLLPAAAGCSGSSGGDDRDSRDACSGSGSPTPPRESWRSAGGGGDASDGSGDGTVADDRFPSADNGNGAGRIPAADTSLQDVGSSGVGSGGAENEARPVVDGPSAAAADAGTGEMPNRRWRGEDRSPVEEVVEEVEGETSSSSSSSSSSNNNNNNDKGSSSHNSDDDRDSGNNQFSFLSSGFDESTLGGMRLPPFSLPRAVVGDGYVQVMGVGHWGVIIFPHEGTWALSLTPNVFNPPPTPPEGGGGEDGGKTTATAAVRGTKEEESLLGDRDGRADGQAAAAAVSAAEEVDGRDGDASNDGDDDCDDDDDDDDDFDALDDDADDFDALYDA
ncbi:unnamed protein product [Ectocarpus sp. 13 AM-2016]